MNNSIKMQQDPTRTYLTWNEFGIIVANKVGEMLLNPPTDEESLKLRLLLMQEELMAMFDEYLWLMMVRADMFAVEYMNRIDPAYHFTTEWTPANDELLSKLLNGTSEYLTNWTNDIREAAAEAIRENTGAPAEQIGQAVANVIDSSKYRGTLIARTELMRAFNSMAEQRYKNAGFRMIWLTAQDPTVCEVCEPLHGRPIDEIKMTPPAHPLCRCTIIPVMKE